jgi:hypothetical protein
LSSAPPAEDRTLAAQVRHFIVEAMRRQGANGHQLGQVWPPSRIPMVNSTPESISEARETLY